MGVDNRMRADSKRALPRCDPVNVGMPALERSQSEYAYFEFWPLWFFYTPVVCYWIYLGFRYRSFSLPMQVNPTIFLGGMIGESKSDILDQFGGDQTPEILTYRVFERSDQPLDQQLAQVVGLASGAGFSMPFVLKPDLGCRGNGVSKIGSDDELIQYLSTLEAGKRYIVQKLARFTAEAGVLYQREPGTQCGRVTSLTLKYRPYVVGDGVSTVLVLLQADPRTRKLLPIYKQTIADDLSRVLGVGEHLPLIFSGSHCRGAIFRNGNAHITPALSRAIDVLMMKQPQFHYGRLDLKFKNLEALMAGEHFDIVEINGVSSEATHIWDARTPLREVFATLFGQYRTLFAYGALIRRHQKPRWRTRTLLRLWFNSIFASR